MPAYYDMQPPKDSWARDLYTKHGLTELATMKEIEPIATRLLASQETALEGAELVMARRIGTDDVEVGAVYTSFGVNAETKFALLLMAKAFEE